MLGQKIFGFILKYVYSLLCLVYLYTIGFLFRKNRDVIAQVAHHFGFGRKKKIKVPFLIPEQSIQDFFSNETPIKVSEPIFRKGNVTLLELMVINQFVQRYQPRAIFEIGTFDGRTTLNLATNCQETAKIYTLDLPQAMIGSTKFNIEEDEKMLVKSDVTGTRFKDLPMGNKIERLYGDSATFDFSSYENKMDFVFIDASHAYDYVINDSLKALKLLRDQKGVILWHDYGSWGGVTKALNELQKTNSSFAEIVHIRDTSLVMGRWQ